MKSMLKQMKQFHEDIGRAKDIYDETLKKSGDEKLAYSKIENKSEKLKDGRKHIESALSILRKEDGELHRLDMYHKAAIYHLEEARGKLGAGNAVEAYEHIWHFFNCMGQIDLLSHSIAKELKGFKKIAWAPYDPKQKFWTTK
ncbi:hypothetical protein KY359_01270 [Candidatus Woesearchaeota archaeon]|nr:hypothetical protein [Candidatus Woesearchaeota archaeon]